MIDSPHDDRTLEDLLELETFSAKYVTRALLTKQYFPNVKKTGEELPPLFRSDTLTVEAAEALGGLKPHAAEWVEIRTRRFDGLIRRIGVPHPVAYSQLVLHLRDHWSAVEPLLGEDRSQIKPQWHDDGRVVQMDYIERSEEHIQHTRLAQGKSYLVKADISNFFPSVYSHALDWALRGKPAAKQWARQPHKKRAKSWEAKLDELVRNVSNQETKGLLIGPAVSNLISELILQRIDEKLAGFEYVRYVDDYSAYFETRDQAEDFLVTLQRELSAFRLDLNTRKTQIVNLREGMGNAWMAAVLSHLPSEWNDLSAARFLQQAEQLSQKHPSASVMKFAAKALLGQKMRLEEGSMNLIDELIRITLFHPHLLPLLSREIGQLGSISHSDTEHMASALGQQLNPDSPMRSRGH